MDDMLSMLMGIDAEENPPYGGADYDTLRDELEYLDPDVAGRMGAYIDHLEWLSLQQYGTEDYGAEEDAE